MRITAGPGAWPDAEPDFAADPQPSQPPPQPLLAGSGLPAHAASRRRHATGITLQAA
jgi:hypothetical protein